MDKQLDEIQEFAPQHDMMEMFEELSFRQNIRKIIHGLKQPKGSGEYKYAKLQVMRLWAPICAAVVPFLAVLLLALFAAMNARPRPPMKFQILQLEPMTKLDPIDKPIEKRQPLPDHVDIDISEDFRVEDTPPSPSTHLSRRLNVLNPVAMTVSPVALRNILSIRSPAGRSKARSEYMGTRQAEDAVLRALRWLKKNQESDGSWPNHRAAMTGLALLTFLAHGETPASGEFGVTVEKALKWLLDNQGANGGWPRRYEHAIATYAMCEAYGMTKVPMLKEAAEKGIDILIKGQNPLGGWRYTLTPTDKSDSSVMGWCCQALKAAKMAGLENEGLDAAIKKAITGWKNNAAPGGGFGYTGPGCTGLTGAGVLCMQLLGAAKQPEAERGLTVLDQATFNWEGGGTFNKNYYWYYITQAKFHAGGDTWKAWNNLFSPVLVKNQTIIKNGIMGPKGKLTDIGFWEMAMGISGHTDGVVMNTALCALQLQVYYRYLPTFKPPEQFDKGEQLMEGDEIEVRAQVNISVHGTLKLEIGN